jgi:hypothetical protein
VFLGLPGPGLETRNIIPKSHFTDRRLNHYTTASLSAHLAEVERVLLTYKGRGEAWLWEWEWAWAWAWGLRGRMSPLGYRGTNVRNLHLHTSTRRIIQILTPSRFHKCFHSSSRLRIPEHASYP